MKFQVHTPGTPPDVENQGLAIGAGKHGYVGFRIAKVSSYYLLYVQQFYMNNIVVVLDSVLFIDRFPTS